jgi:hypothetical protein
MLDSTVLTIGTALRRAHEAGLPVQVLVQGSWLSGVVLNLDGYGAVLDGDGNRSVIRIEHVCVVRVDQPDPQVAARHRAGRVEPADAHRVRHTNGTPVVAGAPG